jgi:hypothetical protein
MLQSKVCLFELPGKRTGSHTEHTNLSAPFTITLSEFSLLDAVVWCACEYHHYHFLSRCISLELCINLTVTNSDHSKEGQKSLSKWCYRRNQTHEQQTTVVWQARWLLRCDRLVNRVTRNGRRHFWCYRYNRQLEHKWKGLRLDTKVMSFANTKIEFLTLWNQHIPVYCSLSEQPEQ